MNIEDLTVRELERIKEVGRTLHFDAVKDFQIFLTNVNNMRDWIESYLQFKRDIELKEIQGYENEAEKEQYYTIRIYWLVFLHAEDDLRMKQLIFYWKDYPNSEVGMQYQFFINRLLEIKSKIENEIESLDLDADWTNYEKSILAKAIETGYVKIEGKHLKWCNKPVLLDYFVGKLFCHDYIKIHKNYRDKDEWVHGDTLKNASRLQELFQYKNLGTLRRKPDRVPPIGWQDIDKLF